MASRSGSAATAVLPSLIATRVPPDIGGGGTFAITVEPNEGRRLGSTNRPQRFPTPPSTFPVFGPAAAREGTPPSREIPPEPKEIPPAPVLHPIEPGAPA